jgi:hypothetical protein
MDGVLQFIQQRKLFVALAGGVVLGLLLGLLVGWVLWPVSLTNATPGQLRSDFQSDYLVWVAENYEAQGGAEWARQKLGVEFWDEGQLEQTLQNLAEERGGETAVRLSALSEALGAEPMGPPEEGATQPEEGATQPEESVEPAPGFWTRYRSPIMVCGVFLLIVAAVLGGFLILNRRREGRYGTKVSAGAHPAKRPVETEGVSWGSAGPPLAQFVTTYTLGDDHYDPSFSIELESGEFMGECGVGISETIGVGEPNKVTAFEVWLFDKNDIRTVTKVVMSDYAFHDEALRTKLAPKGEPVEAVAGEDVLLDTKRLLVRARVVEAEYGMGNLPADSFFERLTVELAAWVKPGPDENSSTEEAGSPGVPPTL